MYKFLIYISQAYGVPIGEPLYAEIEKRGYQVFWFCELEKSKQYIRNKNGILETVQDVLRYQPDIVLTATDVVPDFFSGIKVQLFHGFPAYKRPFKRDHFRIRGLFDLYTTQGPSTTKTFEAIAQKLKTFAVVETGWSKVDPLFPLKPLSANNKPVVMISSTFTPRHSLAKSDEMYAEIKRLSATGKYEFICVLHPMLDKDTKEKFRQLNSENFCYHDTTFLIPLFQKADIMLSDTTSAISEFLLQQKPVVTFRNNNPQNYLLNTTDVNKIESLLDTALNKPDGLMRNIKAFIDELHPYVDGKSSERIVDATINFFNNDQSYLKKKPLNLVRKWKIRKKLNYFTFKSYNKPQTRFLKRS